MPTSEEVFGAFTTVWAELDGDLRSALTQVSAAREEASPTAPGMRSVVAHLEFRDGARFRLRYSFDARDAFLSVEDDVGLHFGFLDDINAYLLDVDFNQPIPSVLTTALAKCVKMHHRASSMSRPASSSGAGAGAGAGAARAAGGAAAVAGGIPLDFQGGMMMYTGSRKQSTRSAAYRIEDHPLAAILAAQQPAQRMRALQAMARPPGGVDGAPAALPLPVGAELDVVNGAAGAGAEAKNGDRKRGVEINFGSSRHATTALMAQVRLLQKQNTRADGFLAQPRDDDLYTWDVSLYFDDPSTALYRDLVSFWVLPTYSILAPLFLASPTNTHLVYLYISLVQNSRSQPFILGVQVSKLLPGGTARRTLSLARYCRWSCNRSRRTLHGTVERRGLDARQQHRRRLYSDPRPADRRQRTHRHAASAFHRTLHAGGRHSRPQLYRFLAWLDRRQRPRCQGTAQESGVITPYSTLLSPIPCCTSKTCYPPRFRDRKFY